jgi:hypothetical protein
MPPKGKTGVQSKTALSPLSGMHMVKLMLAAVNHTNDSDKLDGQETEPTSAPFLNATEPLTKGQNWFHSSVLQQILRG